MYGSRDFQVLQEGVQHGKLLSPEVNHVDLNDSGLIDRSTCSNQLPGEPWSLNSRVI